MPEVYRKLEDGKLVEKGDFKICKVTDTKEFRSSPSYQFARPLKVPSWEEVDKNTPCNFDTCAKGKSVTACTECFHETTLKLMGIEVKK